MLHKINQIDVFFNLKEGGNNRYDKFLRGVEANSVMIN